MNKVVVIGSINVDLVFITDIRPNKGETIFGKDFKTIPGGKGANQAVAASKLGAEVSMIGCLGNDQNGKFSLDNFNNVGVDTKYIKICDDAPTGVANIVIADKDNSIIVVSGANYKADKALIDDNADTIKSADVVLIQLELPYETVKYALQFCAQNGIKTVLDPAPAVELDEEILKNATYMTPNEHECRLIFGKDKDYDITELLKKYPKKLIITMGSAGVKYHDGNDIITVPSHKVEAVDTTGAGDTFNGAFGFAIANNYELKDAIAFGNLAAAESVKKLGAQSGMPYMKDLVK